MAAPALRVLEAQARAYRRTWKGSVVTTFLNPVLFLLAMGVGLGTLVDRGQGTAALAGGSYLAFLAPGLLAATTMQTGAGDSSWPVMAGMKWVKTYHAALATPVGARDIVRGHLGWVSIRLVMTALAFVAVMTAFGASSLAGGLLAAGPAVLTGLAFAGPITAFAASLQTDYALSSLFRFGIVPMFLFSGTFFPVSQLPPALQPVAFVTPLWHGVQLCRAAALGVAPAWPVVVHVGYLLAWFVTGLLLAERAFERRLVR
jgi:lipooligosaccharide transport system permease protein